MKEGKNRQVLKKALVIFEKICYTLREDAKILADASIGGLPFSRGLR